MHYIFSGLILVLSLFFNCVVTSPICSQLFSTSVSPLEQVYERYGRALLEDDILGHRNVTYGVTTNGDVILEGDLIYGTLDDIHNDTLTGGQKLRPRAFSNPSFAFPSTLIKYKYDSDESERKLSAEVQEAMNRWKAGAPYLQFQKIGPNNDKKPDGVLAFASQCGGCVTEMGNGNGYRQMNLGYNCKDRCGPDVVTHELGHALGLFHEHTRPDRDAYVRMHCENIRLVCTNMPAGKTCCDSGLPAGCCNFMHNFDKIFNREWDSSGPYDASSIMHYAPSAFAKPGTLTLDGIGKVKIRAGGWPTDLDFKRMCKLYKKC